LRKAYKKEGWAIFNFIWGQVSVTHFKIFLAKRLAAHAEHAERIAMLEAKTAAMR
jgi:hypothetical protein